MFTLPLMAEGGGPLLQLQEFILIGTSQRVVSFLSVIRGWNVTIDFENAEI